VCLDSGCGNYEQFWLTTSLRGILVGDLHVEILTESIHSGYASGVVPDTFRIANLVISKIEDRLTGKVICPGLEIGVPEVQQKLAEKTAEVLGDSVWTCMPFVEGAHPPQLSNVDLLLNKTWRPTVSITGVDGLPSLSNAGNVLRKHTTLKLSVRLPPNVDNKKAAVALKTALEADPPYGAKVTFTTEKGANGWMSPDLAPWLSDVITEACGHFFDGKPFCTVGEGGTIPFMGMLHQQFPEAQFVITGVLGPNSNAHGPNEFLHLDLGCKVTKTVAYILAQHPKH
jgi:acetylornithine deacetylase/succinyl-diaminopimelate desuccinylase-like protein